MKKIIGLLALIINMVSPTDALAQNKATQFKFSLDVTIQVDGQKPISSTYSLSKDALTIILPPSLWQCWVRETVSAPTSGPYKGMGDFKELVCVIYDKDTPLTQIGTSVIGSWNKRERSFLYLREGKRRIMFDFICEPIQSE